MNIKSILRPIVHKLRGYETPREWPMDERWVEVRRRLSEANTIIDLGCGNYPVEGATAAVDLYIEPKERLMETGAVIDVEAYKKRGIDFVNTRIDGPLPFEDKSFDFAFSHHVFEHLDDPAMACREMMRIAKSGAIITPNYFADIIFGREYHKFLVMQRGNSLLFFKKRSFEDRPFGHHPHLKNDNGTWQIDRQTNPFDMLLNVGNKFRSNEKLPRLSTKLQQHWHGRSPLIEVIFIWDDSFDCQVFE